MEHGLFSHERSCTVRQTRFSLANDVPQSVEVFRMGFSPDMFGLHSSLQLSSRLQLRRKQESVCAQSKRRAAMGAGCKACEKAACVKSTGASWPAARIGRRREEQPSTMQQTIAVFCRASRCLVAQSRQRWMGERLPNWLLRRPAPAATITRSSAWCGIAALLRPVFCHLSAN